MRLHLPARRNWSCCCVAPEPASSKSLAGFSGALSPKLSTEWKTLRVEGQSAWRQRAEYAPQCPDECHFFVMQVMGRVFYASQTGFKWLLGQSYSCCLIYEHRAAARMESRFFRVLPV